MHNTNSKSYFSVSVKVNESHIAAAADHAGWATTDVALASHRNYVALDAQFHLILRRPTTTPAVPAIQSHTPDRFRRYFMYHCSQAQLPMHGVTAERF